MSGEDPNDGAADRLRKRGEEDRPWWSDDPLNATLGYLQMEQRTPSNAPYLGLRALLFLLPAIVIVAVGPLIVPRDVALTIAGAFLSVQLVGPYERMRHRIVQGLNDARRSRKPLRKWVRGQLHRRTLSRPTVREQLGIVRVSPDVYRVDGGTEGPRAWRVAMDRMRARRIERLWRRHTVTPSRGPVKKPPYTVPRAWYPSAWHWRFPLYRRWSLWRCRRLLALLERLLRRYAVDRPVERCTDPVRFLRGAWLGSLDDLMILVDAGELTPDQVGPSLRRE